MRNLLLSLLLTATLASTAAPSPPTYHAALAKVHVCNSSRAYAYHASSTCSGFENCTHAVKPSTTTEAERLGRRPFKRCR